MIERGDVSTGWSMAWKINWWARLQDGDHAYKILSDAFNFMDPTLDKPTMGGGGVYPNLFDAHPPFQIDGNFGVTAGITEMFCKAPWRIGPASRPAHRMEHRLHQRNKGPGNFTVTLEWRSGALTAATVTSGSGASAGQHPPSR